MSTLYLDRQVASIEREGASIVIRDREGRRSNLPLHLLDRIVIRGTVGLDTSGAIVKSGYSPRPYPVNDPLLVRHP